MSETMAIQSLSNAAVKRPPTVYFIDDSATMREVIKIAFRRENINVITCANAAAALAQFEQNRPDLVITDVIMPDQDGYSVCSQIKQHPQYSSTPVVLMSGVVNKSVADKAVSVKADELIRKPFQPQELIVRVKGLLGPKLVGTSPVNERSSSDALGSLFSPLPTQPTISLAPPLTVTNKPAEYAWPRALAEAFTSRPVSAPNPPVPIVAPNNLQPLAQPVALSPIKSGSVEIAKLRAEIVRIELLVKKLQTELQLERQYTQALEQQIRTLMQSE